MAIPSIKEACHLRSVATIAGIAFIVTYSITSIALNEGSKRAGSSPLTHESQSPVSGVLRPGRFWGRTSFVPNWSSGRVADADSSRQFIEQYWPQLQAATACEPKIPKTRPRRDTARSARVFPVEYWSATPPGYVPHPTALFAGTTVIRAARGESEPIAIGIRVSGESATVRISASDPVGVNGRLSGDVSSVHVMLPYCARVPGVRGRREFAEQQMVLLAPPGGTWPVAREHTVVFIADFHIPVSARPGEYNVQLSIEIDGIETEKIDVLLEVLPFELRVNDFHAGAFGTTYDLWEGGFTGYYPEMMDVDSRYGFNLAGGFFNKGHEIPFLKDSNGVIRVAADDPKFDAFTTKMLMLRRYGMGDVVFWNWGASGNVRQFNNVLDRAGVDGNISTDVGKRGFGEVLRAIKKAEIEYGWPEIVINPFDEALKDQRATRELIRATSYAKILSPESRLYMTEWHPGYARHYQSSGRHLVGDKRPREAEFRALRKSEEEPRLNFAVIGSNRLDDDGREVQDVLGGEYWNYTGASRMGPEVRFALGLKPWIQRSEAVLIWANYKGDLNGHGWTVHFAMPLDARGRERGNTRGPVIPSARAIVVREGIDDRKYIETLRFHAWRLKSHDDLTYLHRLSQKARAMLLNYAEIGGSDNIEARLRSGAGIQTIREQLQRRILSLLAQDAKASAGLAGGR